MQEIHDGPSVGRVALMAADYPYMKPKMLVKEGDAVKNAVSLFSTIERRMRFDSRLPLRARLWR